MKGAPNAQKISDSLNTNEEEKRRLQVKITTALGKMDFT